MNRRFLWIAAVFLAGAVVYMGSRTPKQGGPSTPATNPAQPQTAPDFSLTSLDGKPIRLSDYRGKLVLLDFWATWCAGCKAEIPRFMEWQQKYGAQGLVVLGVSMDDSSQDAVDYARKMKISYPVVMGTPQLADSYGGVLGLPVNLLIARDGRIVSKYVGVTDLAAMERQITEQLKQ